MIYVKDFIKKLIFTAILAIGFFVVVMMNDSFPELYSEDADFDHNVRRLMTVTEDPELKGDYTDVVLPRDASVNSELFPDVLYCLLVGDTDKQVYAAKNAHNRMYPASMTKLMTASVVCDLIESGRIGAEDIVTIENYYDLTSEGVRPFSLSKGCRISVRNLMYGLLLESNNYYALVLADYIAGSEEAFVRMMNEKAQKIGATNTHYMNPHGLDDVDHYTTAYDTYLVICEAKRHDLIRIIDKNTAYDYVYWDTAGNEVDARTEATNYFYQGMATLPAGVSMEVWKTGTTDGAGNCLVIYYTKNEKSYVACACNLESKITLYDAMIRMICLTE